MALTQADLDRLDAAIASSELKVEVDGRSITYRDTNQLLTARKHVADVLRQSAGGACSGGATHYFTPILTRER